MAKPQHRSPEYLAEKRRLTPVIAAVGAECVERVCLYPTRLIPPGTSANLWHLCHDPSGLIILGPGHRRCNLAESARRNNPKRNRASTERRWRL